MGRRHSRSFDRSQAGAASSYVILYSIQSAWCSAFGRLLAPGGVPNAARPLPSLAQPDCRCPTAAATVTAECREAECREAECREACPSFLRLPRTEGPAHLFPTAEGRGARRDFRRAKLTSSGRGSRRAARSFASQPIRPVQRPMTTIGSA